MPDGKCISAHFSGTSPHKSRMLSSCSFTFFHVSPKIVYIFSCTAYNYWQTFVAPKHLKCAAFILAPNENHVHYDCLHEASYNFTSFKYYIECNEYKHRCLWEQNRNTPRITVMHKSWNTTLRDGSSHTEPSLKFYQHFCITLDFSNQFLTINFNEFCKEIPILHPKNCKVCVKMQHVLAKRTRCNSSRRVVFAQAVFFAIFKRASLSE